MWWIIEFIVHYLRPTTNFQVKRMFKRVGNELIPVRELKHDEQGHIDYYFGGKLYTHIGQWPIQHIVPRFSIPIHTALFISDDDMKPIVCTETVRRHSGPTQSPISFDKYSPRPYISFSRGVKISMGIKWVLTRKVTGTIYVQDVLGQRSSYSTLGAK